MFPDWIQRNVVTLMGALPAFEDCSETECWMRFLDGIEKGKPAAIKLLQHALAIELDFKRNNLIQ